MENADMTAKENPSEAEVDIVLTDHFIDELIGGTIIFEAANGYGLSARDAAESGAGGKQLYNNRDHNDEFRVHRKQPGIYKFESVSAPGLYIGLEAEKTKCRGVHGLRSILVEEGDESALLRAVPARNGSDFFLSFEAFWHPGFLLNHFNGLIWFFDKPVKNEKTFALDSSWKLLPVLSAEEKVLRLEQFMDSLENQSIIFEAANGYGLSARYAVTTGFVGEQLCNERKHNDEFRVHRVQEGVYAFESVLEPGLYLGVDDKQSTLEKSTGYKSILLKEGDERANLRVVPARNDSDYLVSFESVAHPGFLLNHCMGLIWFFDKPPKDDKTFLLDSSWKLLPVESMEERVRKLEKFMNDLENRPIFFEAANDFSLSTRNKNTTITEGEQLFNTRNFNDKFLVHKVDEGVYKFESVTMPGLYIGVDPQQCTFLSAMAYQCVLVEDGDEKAHLRVIPSRNGSNDFVSFEPVSQPGFLLNHCHDMVWFFNRPANDEDKFALDSSWKLLTEENMSERMEELKHWKSLW